MPNGGEILDIVGFLKARNTYPVVDVRSPQEYRYGHIPMAVNIPLFDDFQRAETGTVYKKEGREKAIMRALELVGGDLAGKLRDAIKTSAGGPLLVHCWRGGMRSEAMSWLFSLAEIKTFLLRGGYKVYRNHILEDVGKERRLIILGGLTGSGKTHILNQMKKEGRQVTDLESLASHKGSAFGALGQPPQPSSEHFANLLFDDLNSWNSDEDIWLEDESRNLGSVFMPDPFYIRMQEAPVIALMMSIDTRLPRLLEEYSGFPVEQITASILRISKRLGGDRTREALDAVARNDFSTAIRVTLEYYDRSYSYGLSKRKKGQVIIVNSDTDDIMVNSGLVMDAAGAMR